MSLSIGEDVTAAVKDVRDDRSTTNWCLASFPDLDSWQMQLVGSGSGGVDELSSSIYWQDACFGILRRDFEYEATVGMGKTVVSKFILISVRPDNLDIKRKKKLSVYEGQIKKVFQPTHMDIEVAQPDDISEKIVQDLILRVTQKKDMQTDRAASSFVMAGVAVQARTSSSDAKSAQKQSDTLATSFAGAAGGAAVDFDDVQLLKESIQDVRNDATPTQWCLFGYSDPKTISFIGKGEGQAPEEMLAACPDGATCYGFFRVLERIELTTAVKFVFVTWQNNVPVMARAKISTHKSVVLPMFRPFHVDFFVEDRNELTLDIVMDKIQTLSGTKSMVTSAPVAKVEEKFQKKTLGGVPANERISIEVRDPDVINGAIKEVRHNTNGIEWAVAGIASDGASLEFVNKGGDGLDAFRQAMTDPARVLYGIVRRTHKIDNTTAIKFLFVVVQGSNIPVTLKSKVGSYRGHILEIFRPFHADVFLDDIAELTDEMVLEKIGAKY